MELVDPKLAKDPVVQYLKQINKNHAKPISLPFQNRLRQDDEEGMNEEEADKAKASIAMKSFYITGGFSKAFSKTLQLNSQLNTLVLRRTNMSDANFQVLIPNIHDKLKKLDLSKNPSLSIKSYRFLCGTLMDVRARLTHLNLDGNHIGDQTCGELCTLFSHQRSLKVLNLSKCSISDAGAHHVA